ncbi:MAG: hypothetical protein IJK41_09310 [Muribaculaceae bacterium]|nr:hypothetical protein [Muribaculaceae bacterium]
MSKTTTYNTYNLSVLTSKSFSYDLLAKAWGTQKRDLDKALYRFQIYNTKYLKFLDITSRVVDVNGIPKLELTSSKYVGCVPTVSPKGQLAGNIEVKGRFNEDIAELLSMIGESPLLEYNEDFKLSSGAVENPPLYFECLKFIDKYIEAKRYKWRKFESVEAIEQHPSSSTKWVKYANNYFNPNKRLLFNNQKNTLSKEHREWAELNYVLDLSIQVVLSPSTPSKSRLVYKHKIDNLQSTYDKNNLRYVHSLTIHMSDPIIIKELKTIANRILKGKSSSNCAWRIDFAEFFERYAQFIMKELSIQKRARIYCNPKYSVRGEKPNWVPKYIEPDIVIEKNNTQFIIDAKYKSHMYNLSSSSESLKEVFREDFMQVLAYSSFGDNKKKNVILIYPSGEYKVREMRVGSCINNCSANVYLIGIPLRKSDYKSVKERLSEIINF